ncbi:MAG: Tim44 domain-containing protein [Betaproteobacteria bacterium]|nr:MAG: Tim44 domain-containing protein [Betaproteobacteria bacterium]
MKQLLLSLFVAIFSFGFVAADAEAKRLGGGSSLGMQRSAPAQAPRQPAATPPNQTPAAAPAQQPGRSWMGPVAGLAAGLGLAALASHLGFGEELASFMMLALLAIAAVVVFRLLFRRGSSDGARPQQGLQYAGAPAGAPDSTAPRLDAAAQAASSVSAAASRGFDAEGFARQAKVNFIRLQAANDAGDLDDIREFTTPEMFAEIRLQLGERGPAAQRTDVVKLDADVIDVAEEGGRYIVSVRFSGLLREEADSAPAPFDEIWHLTKPTTGTAGWVIAGIQQTH